MGVSAASQNLWGAGIGSVLWPPLVILAPASQPGATFTTLSFPASPQNSRASSPQLPQRFLHCSGLAWWLSGQLRQLREHQELLGSLCH